MKVSCPQRVKERAKSEGNYLVGFIANSPHPNLGVKMELASPALNEDEAATLYRIVAMVCERKISASDVEELINDAREPSSVAMPEGGYEAQQ